jgi:hypothetical protein
MLLPRSPSRLPCLLADRMAIFPGEYPLQLNQHPPLRRVCGAVSVCLSSRLPACLLACVPVCLCVCVSV